MSLTTKHSLLRKPGEAIRIGPGITVSVTHVSADLVHLCVEAPLRTHISRQETYLDVLEENRRAALPGPIYLHAAAALLPARGHASTRGGGKAVR